LGLGVGFGVGPNPNPNPNPNINNKIIRNVKTIKNNYNIKILRFIMLFL